MLFRSNLYRAHPDAPEGQLAKMRAATVSEPALAAVARDLGVGEFIKLGKGEALSGGRRKDSILADTVEALIGAAYLTHGLEPTREVVTRLVSRFLSGDASTMCFIISPSSAISANGGCTVL